MFRVEVKADYFVKTPGIYDNYQRLELLYHILVAGCPIPISRKGLPGPKMLCCADYNVKKDNSGSHSSFIYVFSNIALLSPN